MKKLILLCLFIFILNNIFGQHYSTQTQTDTNNITIISIIDTVFVEIYEEKDTIVNDSFNLAVLGGTDSCFYYLIPYSGEFGGEMEMIQVARTCVDSVIFDWGYSQWGNTFTPYNSDKFPYTLDAADSLVNNGVHSLTVGDWGLSLIHNYLVIKITVTGDCKSGWIKWMFTIRKFNK